MNGRRLYEEIGGVDERYLQQAAAYRARKQAPAWRALLIAAALTLVGALLLCTIAASVTIGVLVGILGEGEDIPVRWFRGGVSFLPDGWLPLL